MWKKRKWKSGVVKSGGMERIGLESNDKKREGILKPYFFIINTDKSTRKMDENEYIQQVFEKHRTYSNRLMLAKNEGANNPVSKPETKVERVRERMIERRTREGAVDNREEDRK
jgi:hypothetical protein